MKRLRDRDAFGLLLATIIASILLLAVGGHARIATIVAQGGAMMIGLITARVRRGWLIVALVVTAIITVAAILQGSAGAGKGYAVTASIGGLLLAIATIVAIGHRVRRFPRVSISTVYAAITVYLLLGLAYAYLFSAIGELTPGGFFRDHSSVPEVEFIYFSFTALTSTGFGDYVARTPTGQITSITEAIVGQLYLVTVLAVVVGNLGQPRRPHRNPP